MIEEGKSLFGKLIFGIGVILVIVGLGFWLFADKLGWVGNLQQQREGESPRAFSRWSVNGRNLPIAYLFLRY